MNNEYLKADEVMKEISKWSRRRGRRYLLRPRSQMTSGCGGDAPENLNVYRICYRNLNLGEGKHYEE